MVMSSVQVTALHRESPFHS